MGLKGQCCQGPLMERERAARGGEVRPVAVAAVAAHVDEETAGDEMDAVPPRKRAGSMLQAAGSG